MTRVLLICLFLSACGGVAWDTTVADHPQVRDAMLRSVVPGQTTEKRFVETLVNRIGPREKAQHETEDQG